MPKRVIYRDKRTGRFAKKSTWKRSKAQGGKRYVRKQVATRKTKPSPPPRIQAPSTAVFEWLVTITPSASSDRNFDVIVTARDEGEAYSVARKFLASDTRGRQIIRAGGWHEAVAARGKRTNEEAGEAGYRFESRK